MHCAKGEAAGLRGGWWRDEDRSLYSIGGGQDNGWGGDAQLMSDRGGTDRRVTTGDSDCLMMGLMDTNNPMRRGGVMQER